MELFPHRKQLIKNESQTKRGNIDNNNNNNNDDDDDDEDDDDDDDDDNLIVQWNSVNPFISGPQIFSCFTRW